MGFYRDLWINGLELEIDGSGSGNATSEPNHYEHGAPADGVVYITVHDPKTCSSDTGICSTQQMCHIMNDLDSQRHKN